MESERGDVDGAKRSARSSAPNHRAHRAAVARKRGAFVGSTTSSFQKEYRLNEFGHDDAEAEKILVG